MRAPLGLEQLAALEGPARGVGEVAGERDLIVGELPLVAEEHDDGVPEPRPGRNRRDEQGAVAGRDDRLAPAGLEAVVVPKRARRDDALLAGPRDERARRGGDT